jgi:hypothetical protein
MNISKEGLDSRVLRWSGFVMAGFIAASLAVGMGSEGPGARRQLSEGSTTTVRIGQVNPASVSPAMDRTSAGPACGESC